MKSVLKKYEFEPKDPDDYFPENGEEWTLQVEGRGYLLWRFYEAGTCGTLHLTSVMGSVDPAGYGYAITVDTPGRLDELLNQVIKGPKR